VLSVRMTATNGQDKDDQKYQRDKSSSEHASRLPIATRSWVLYQLSAFVENSDVWGPDTVDAYVT
jgi:hypothetical protein